MDIAEQRSAKAFLRKCVCIYEALVARVLELERRGDDDKALRWLSLAADVAWFAHPGRFVDERLEAVALRVGQRLQVEGGVCAGPFGTGALPASGPRRVLHVATTVYDIGGHTRLIDNWIKANPAAVHSLVLTDQPRDDIPAQLVDRIAASGGEVVVVPLDISTLDKARQLRQVAQADYDCLILHQHPNDVVPLVALAIAECPPVALMNHADHVFWLGVSVADAVIDFRDYGSRLSIARRGARRSLMFPLPIDLCVPTIGREDARAHLSISPAEVMLLSIGSAYKYTPNKTHDFFRTLDKVLAQNPEARLYVIGVSPEEFHSFGAQRHERMELLGIISDPSVYEAAADLYLEGFPINSYTAMFETSAHAICPVLMYAPTPQVDLSCDAALKGLVTSASDEVDYIARVSSLINDPVTRTKLGQEVARRIASVNSDIGQTYLEPIYEALATTRHQPTLPPAQAAAEMESDLNLASFNSAQIRMAVLSQAASRGFARLTLGDFFHLLAISIWTGDTCLTFAHIKRWSTLFLRKAFPFLARLKRWLKLLGPRAVQPGDRGHFS